MKRSIIMFTILFWGGVTFAQSSTGASDKDKYVQIVTERSNKIVASLNLTDSVKFKKVRDIVAAQYISLNDIYDARNASRKQIKDQAGEDKAVVTAKIAEVDSNVNKQLKAQHAIYLSKLSKELNASQVDQIKDGMTYRVYPLTYAAYQDELPNLTDVQKGKIKAWLIEARENAIDAESSEKKHAWFGKFKGRINNYLSAEGYDMKKEGEEWQKRIKERNMKN
ncbi:DUF3826 domain-containing protein [Mucilaginibacter aquaedulcis]|uniref:DUF3826 domain-containing protein n=1 Tax=Mucilaginibacter aquaedulcis TaxID=1187081 RepID=UPI0025B57A84|nr:DUF3826 domain-containing protein [Mucilaginibacter aquaedulcis]MDN3548436.1 DUF3826 domain-containing protein [Mucilaginibacter aquaedulcis]